MKISEMFKKLETYNEMAVLMGSEQAHITFNDRDSHTYEYFKTYKNFKNYMKREYVDWFVKPLIKQDNFEFDEDKDFMAVDPFGIEIISNVCFSLNID